MDRLEISNFKDTLLTLKACQNAENSILATSISAINGYNWWNAPQGKNYLEENIKVIQRGVKIERVFIY